MICRKKIFIIKILILLAFLVGCAEIPTKWDRADKTAFITSTGLSVIDCFQTRKIKDDSRYGEKYNPIIKKLDKGETTLYFIGSWATTWWIADKLKPKWRKAFLGGKVSVQIRFVAKNFSIGLGIPID